MNVSEPWRQRQWTIYHLVKLAAVLVLIIFAGQKLLRFAWPRLFVPPTGKLQILAPEAFAVIGSFPPIEVVSPAPATEVVVRILDWNGRPLAEAEAVSDSSARVALRSYLPYALTELGWIEAESLAQKIKTQVSFERATSTVRLYFAKAGGEPTESCKKVFPVSRTVLKNQDAGRAALEELLRGPSEQELSEGLITAMPLKVKLKSFERSGGEVRADFDAGLKRGIGSECALAALRRQIEETIKAAAAVERVVILIEGKAL
ncbi:hypothetical protein EPN90_00870 [Patescibacteria group bacterium]|nr:MAG: hypothetical protein EPN90_00870 [Patescibacteria group bacterium]